MTDTNPKPKRSMPKGGRKGGAVFPRVTLADAVGYAKKLVSKTHVNLQPIDIIHLGVVGAKSGKGAVRMSALKQYGFLKGDTKAGFGATEFAKKLVSAPPEDLLTLYQQAVLKPTVFKSIFDAFHGDVVSRAKLKQRAADLKVHPDETETCIETYVKSLELAGLVTVDGDQVSHIPANGVSTAAATSAILDEASEDEPTDSEIVDKGDPNVSSSTLREKNGDAEEMANRPKAVFNVNVTLDSSLDTEKLQKQLELLKRFGAI